MSPFARRSIVRIVGAGLIAQFYGFVVYALLSGPFDAMLLRALFSLRGPRLVPQSVSVVRVDARSYRRLRISGCESSFPFLAEAIEKTSAAGARLIVLDYFLRLQSSDKGENERLRKALANTPTVIGRAIDYHIDTDLNGKRSVSVEHVRPAEVFAESAREVVQLVVRTEDDVVSRISLSDDASYQALDRVPLLRPLRKWVSPGIEEPGDYDLINFYGDAYGIPDVPLYRLLSEDEPVPEEYFKDKVVFIGAVDLPGSKDGKDDSFSISASRAPMWGVEILATIAANILDGSWIRRLSPEKEAPLLNIAVLFLTLCVFTVGLYRGFIVTAALAAVWLAFSYWAFAHWLFFVPGATVFGVMMPLVLLGMSIGAAMKLRNRLRTCPVCEECR